MKNMKIKNKLITTFIAVAILAAIAGIFGIYGLNKLNSNEENMYLQATISNEVALLWKNVQTQRATYRGAALKYYMALDYSGDVAQLDSLDVEFDTIMADLKSKITLPENQTRLDKTQTAYNEYKTHRTEFIDAVTYRRTDLLAAPFAAMSPKIDIMIENLQLVTEYAISNMDATNIADAQTAARLIILMIVLVILAVSSAIFFAFYISGLISKPLVILTEFMNRAGKTGDIILRKVDEETIGAYADAKDETGQCIASTANFIKHLSEVALTLEAVSNGDLTADLELLSDKDTMGMSLKKMTENLNNMFSEINVSTAQVATGSKQLADGSQALAQGSTEQAAAVEQLSSSIAEIAQKTQENAKTAVRAANLAGTIKNGAEKGSVQMDQMMDAVKEINQASQSINKVIKVIEDIAFQTNILALNAAVEAARAGQHGKGFAVVAEEVRNLAAKSAEAAKDTGGLIANSMEKAELGARIADETAASLNEIVTGIKESSQLVNEIAKLSEEQSAGIIQINKGIDQVASVVQQNSATAEQSAAASEEMSGQSNMLESLVAQFKLKNNNRIATASISQSAPPKRQLNMPKLPERGTSSNNSCDFGKY